MISSSHRAPVLVLALGNYLLRDDAVGLQLLAQLTQAARDPKQVEFLDGGTQGTALLGAISHRQGLLILDAVALGAAPGTVHVLDSGENIQRAAPESVGAAPHESNAGELLTLASLLGDRPDVVVVVGIEPADLRTGIGLSPAVKQALPSAAERAEQILSELLLRR